ncbi:phage tail fiber protein [Buttiauxella agrestis]|uniref:phage tail fiber protein n=1 Tax=Buttiauxella agrestis TaxID=82977 RepID=UPI0039763955
MPAGTITLTNNSTAVTGSGTAFPTELKANDFLVAIVGGTTYTLGVKSVESATALTLTTAYGGPTSGGLAWTPIPNGTLVGITAQIAADTARAIRGLNYDKQNWQQVYSASGNITVTLPDGSTWTGPSWKYLSDNMATKVSGAVPIEQGGTGATNASGARTALALGNSATKSTGTSPGNVMEVGAFGVGVNGDGAIGSPQLHVGNPATNITRFAYAPPSVAIGFLASAWRAGLEIKSSGATGLQLWGSAYSQKPQLAMRCANSSSQGYSDFAEFYSTVNTTKAADGTLKAASPVVKIFADGRAETNAESEGVAVTRQGRGEYLIEGCMGLNSDASWGGIDGGFDVPADRNKQPLIWLDYKVNPDGSVLVKTFHRTYPEAPEFARNEIDGFAGGAPIDIPADQFVSVRVEMPHDSIYNQAQEAAQKALEEVERLAVEEAARKATEEAQTDPDQPQI